MEPGWAGVPAPLMVLVEILLVLTLSYLVLWSVHTAKAFEKLNDLKVELKFLLWIFC